MPKPKGIDLEPIRRSQTPRTPDPQAGVYAVYAFVDLNGFVDKIRADDINFKGDWAKSTSCKAKNHDIVRMSNDLYIAIKDTTGWSPTDKLPHGWPNPYSLLVVIQPGAQPPFTQIPAPPPPNRNPNCAPYQKCGCQS